MQQFSTTEVFCYADISGLIDNILQNVERKVFFAMENGHRLVEFSTRFYILWASFPITLAQAFFYNTTWAEERGESLPDLEFFP